MGKIIKYSNWPKNRTSVFNFLSYSYLIYLESTALIYTRASNHPLNGLKILQRGSLHWNGLQKWRPFYFCCRWNPYQSCISAEWLHMSDWVELSYP